MDSKSTLAPNLRGGSWKGERNCSKQDQFAHRIASSVAPRPQLRIDSWMETLLDDIEQRSVSISVQEEGLFHDSLVISGKKSRTLNPWAAVGSVALLSLVLLALVVIPLFHTDVVLPERKTLTMLYLPPAAPASNVASLRVPTSAFKNTPTKLSFPSPVHTTQEAPAAPVVTASGVVGGVPGGVFGGIPGGTLTDLLRSKGTAPVLTSTRAPAPKRTRVPARIAEANLVYDVAPKYPPEAGRERIEGIVVLMAVIGKDGTVRDVRIESGLPVLAQAAIEAVKQWRYRPYLLNGEPVEIDSQITINFNLSKG
jgi:protein TonB